MKKIWMAGLVLFAVGNSFGADSPRKALIHAAQHGAEGMLTLHVLDDEGRPVNAADIQANFPKPLFNPGEEKWATDTNGFCVLNGIATDDIVYSINKSGYYETRGWYAFSRQKMPMVVDGKWQPWNPTNTVVLKSIKKPVAMYVKEVETKIPNSDKQVGFDLEEGDWIAPYGRGLVADFVFNEECEYRSKSDFTSSLQLHFSNEKDGIQSMDENIDKKYKSTFSSSHEAPVQGYSSEWIKIRGKSPEKGWIVSEKEPDIYYIFRVRTVLDQEKKIVRTNYGKIYGPIEYYYKKDEPSVIRFTYYFNHEPNSRNLEFDTSHNLFPGVKINQP